MLSKAEKGCQRYIRIEFCFPPHVDLIFRAVYYQAMFATGAGYVYCLLFFLSGGRLVPTVLLHSANNMAASFYSFTHDLRPSTAGYNSNGILGGVAFATANTSSRTQTAHFPFSSDGHGVGQKLNVGVDQDSMADAGWVTCAGWFATIVAYWHVGRACSTRTRQSYPRGSAAERGECCPVLYTVQPTKNKFS